MTWHGAIGKRGTYITLQWLGLDLHFTTYVDGLLWTSKLRLFSSLLCFALLCFRWFFYSAYFLAQSRRDDKIIWVVWRGGGSCCELSYRRDGDGQRELPEGDISFGF
ncbi:hypothetical protein QR685DRAFT_202487 [Neurospora intermedia]|uniref:Transmembrane protein n=1 Tax=Neurospora intermedia TaxID=5142 RepID=A0ABR3DG98_NEUIN